MTSLQRLRVLVVEDEGPIAMMIEDMLQDMGCLVVGSAATVKDALKCVHAGGFDFAILDVNLAGQTIEPVADTLSAEAIPFAFASGYGRAGLPHHFRDAPVIQKPFTRTELERLITTTFGR